MNIAITDGLILDPPGFAAGLGVWSREHGTPGSATWAGAGNAGIVAADADFGPCLEITKQETTTRLRFMGETPILPGTYLRISARVKVVAGTIPALRIGAFAGDGTRNRITTVTDTGASVTPSGYNRVVTVSAIVGTGSRSGVTMAWGRQAVYGHFGLDLTGANGGTLRIESIRIEDCTADFLRKMLDWVDVRDFGARGDGVTDDRDAFAAADAAAGSREMVVPEGVYLIGSNLSITAPVRFVGTLTMPRAARLALMANFDFPTYADAFGDETEGFKRGLQALFGWTDHGSFDLRGRRVDLTEPILIHEIAPGVPGYSNRRVLANGQIRAVPGPAWQTGTASSSTRYDPGQSRQLSEVANVANIEVGSRVSGPGVGREVYVKAKNIAAGTLTLSQPLHGGAGTRLLNFERYRYVLDFSGVSKYDRFNISDVDFTLDGEASCLMLPPEGEMFHIRDCYVARPKDRAITSIGRGCQDLLVDRCQFLSNEMGALAQNRTSVAINVNANDTKIRDNRFVRFGTFLIAAGAGHIISGNHWFQGDGANPGLRTPGLVLIGTNVQTTITGNYIDNNAIEWTNEYHPNPNFTGGALSFGALTITGNTFLCSNSVAWFSFIVIKPYGSGHFVHGLTVSGNVFKADINRITRIERVDDTFAPLDLTRMRNIRFEGNTFTGVETFCANPLQVTHSQPSLAQQWTIPSAGQLPLGGWAKNVDSVVATSSILDSANSHRGEMPWIQVRQGTDERSLRVNWPRPVRGDVTVRLRMDNPD